MDLYLSNCLKAAEAAASKAASGSLTNNKDACSTKKQKAIIPKIGPSNLLDLPLGAKLPVIPGSTNIFYTTNISEKLYQPSFGFNLNDPYCKLMETTYKSLHDPHLKSYFKRKDILKKLRKEGYITGNNKVVCSLKELNKYRQYLTTLKIDFERNYIREQKIIENQVNKLNEERRACDNAAAAAEFQRWLLQEGKKASPHQDRLIKLRHLNMINKELDKIENTMGKRSTAQTQEEDIQYLDEIRRKLNLRQQVEEEWQFKEMSLLTKIGEEVKRETKVEEHRRKIREEINQKKQLMLQKRIAYHLQKLQKKDSQEKRESSVSESKRQSETVSSTTQRQPSVTEPKIPQEHLERKPSTSSILTSFSERLMQESRESKSSSQMTRTSFDEDRASLYELLETRFSPIDTRRLSLPEDQTFHDVLEPKHYHHSGGKKTSFAEEALFYEHGEKKYGPLTTKKTSFSDDKFMEDLLEAKYLYQNTKRTSFTDHKPMEDNLEPILTPPSARRTSVSDQRLFYEPIKPKSPPSIKKTSFADEKSFQQLMEAITPPQYVKKTSFADQRSSQESVESRRSSHHSQNNMVFVKTSTTLPPQQRDLQSTTDLKYDKVSAKTSHHSRDRGMKKISNPASSQSLQSTVLSRQSCNDVPTQEVDPTFQRNTHKQNK